MKHMSNIKKKKIHKKNRSGFTLIELLATIAVLSVVITIVIYVATGVVDSAKEKSYQVTINNIEKSTGSYVLEGNSLMPWLDGNTSNYQYQCVTVQNLIDTGYFKGDILESEVADGIKVKANNVIYLERDQNTKSITKNILLVGDMKDYENGLCGSIEADGDITISVEPNGWSREKDVTINYRILKNTDKVSGYSYSYQYNTNKLNKKFNKQVMTEKIHIIENNMNISSTIYNESGGSIANGSVTIDKIDRTGPVITNNYTGNNVVWNRVEIPITITDSQSGVDANSVLLSDFEVSIGSKVLTSGLTLEKTDANNYKLIIENNYDAGKVKIKIGANKISDLVIDEIKNGNTETILTPNVSFSNLYTIKYDSNGGNGSMSATTCTYGKECAVSTNTFTKTGYTFIGWTTKSDKTTDDNYKWTNWSGTWNYINGQSEITNGELKLYAQWKANVATIKYKINSGETLTSSTGAGTWSNAYGIIKLNGAEAISQVAYDSVIGGKGLLNYNNAGWLNITKTGHSGVAGAEWKCVSNNCNKQTYDQDDNQYKATDFCDLSKENCTVTLGVNWKPNTYTISYENNLFYEVNVGTTNGVKVSYDYTNSTVTLNGTTTSSLTLGYLYPDKLISGDKYKISMEYVSGGISSNGSWTGVFDTVNSNGDVLSTRNYVDVAMPTSGIKSKDFSISPLGASQGNKIKSWIWLNTGVSVTFNNYVVKVKFIKDESVNITYGNKYILSSNNTTRKGYKLLGWYDSSGNKITESLNMNIAGNHSLYTKWSPYKVNILFAANGGDVTQTTSGGTFTVGNNNTIYINDSQLKYSYNYGTLQSANGLPDYNNKNYLNITKTGYSASDGKEWKCLSGCSTNGREFDHSAAYKASDFCDASNGDCTVILGVNWKPNTYKINYSEGYDLITGRGNIGSTTVGRMTYSITNDVVTVQAKQNDGYGFIPYRVKLTAGTSYVFNATCTAAWESECQAWLMKDGQYTTYYEMKDNKNYIFTPSVTGEYWLRLDVNTNGNTQKFSNISITKVLSSQTVTYDDSLNLTSVPTKDGYTFKGYYNSIKARDMKSTVEKWDGTVRVNLLHDANGWLKTSSDVGTHIQAVLIIKDSALAIAPELDFNDVQLTKGTHYKVYGDEGYWYYQVDFDITDYMVSPRQYGYDKSHRFIDITSSAIKSSTEVDVGTTVKDGKKYLTSDGICVWHYDVAGDMILYGLWEPNTYKISYDANGGSVSTTSKNITYGSQVGTLPTPTRKGYTFKEWNTRSDGSGTTYNDSTTYNQAGNITLYAIWQAKPIKILFNTNGGTVIGKYQADSSGWLNKDDEVFKESTVNDVSNYNNPEWINISKVGYSAVSGAEWNTQPNGSGTSLNHDTKYTYADMKTIQGIEEKSDCYELRLYVNWEEHHIIFEYYANNGESGTFVKWDAHPSQKWPDNHWNYTSSTYAKTKIGYTATGYYGTTETGGTLVGEDENFKDYVALCAKYGVDTQTKLTTIKIYAQWKANTYKVSYDANGGSGSMDATTCTYGSNCTLRGNTFTKTGYTFNGWTTSSGSTNVEYYDERTLSPYLSTNNMTLYAVWQDKTIPAYTSAEIKNITYTGYDVYVYGVSDASGINRVQFPTWTDANGKDDIQANWSTNTIASGTNLGNGTWKYRVNVSDHNNESGIYHTHVYIYDNDGNENAFAINNIYVPGYHYLDLNGILDGASTGNISGYGTADVYINGTLVADNVSDYWTQWQEGTSYEIKDIKTVTGKKYNGVYSGSIKGTVGGETTNVYLSFITATYTINYQANGGSVSPTSQSITYGSKIETLPTPKRDGYTFSGWNTRTDGNGTTYTTATKYEQTDDITLYAIWKPNTYEITYNANGGNVSTTSKSVTYDSQVGILPTSTRTGYTFVEWNTSSDGNGTTYTTSTTYKQTGDITLYAIWKINTYEITYNANGGSVSPTSQSITYDSQVGTLPTPKRDGYTFLGWNTNSNGTGTTYTTSTTYNKTGDITLYAIWIDSTPPTCTISVSTSNVSMIVDDNVSVTNKGLSTSATADYNNQTSVSLTKGKIYGYVEDAAGNTGSCSVEIVDTEYKYTCSIAASSQNSTTGCTTSNYNNPSSACGYGYTYSSDTCSSRTYYAKHFQKCTKVGSSYKYTNEGPEYGNMSCTVGTKIMCNQANAGYTYISQCELTDQFVEGNITCSKYSCSSGTLSGSKCYKYNQNSCSSGWSWSASSSYCADSYTRISGKYYCYKILN